MEALLKIYQLILAEQAPLIEAKATADYCANEYLAEIMGDVNKEYGYTYGSDQTLQRHDKFIYPKHDRRQ